MTAAEQKLRKADYETIISKKALQALIRRTGVERI